MRKTKLHTSSSRRSGSPLSGCRHLARIMFGMMCVGATGLIWYSFMASPALAQTRPESSENKWKQLDLLQEPLPDTPAKDQVSVQEHTVNVMGVDVFYREAEPSGEVSSSGQILFLLHGAAFTSATWVERIPTVQTISSLGHRVIAVDLPGFGKTRSYSGDYAQFLESLIKALCEDVKPVLVSPSMSGSFSVPLLKRNQDAISGYIPVAPVATNELSDSEWSRIQVPTMIVYGENDHGLGKESLKRLQLIPTSTKPVELPKAGHPAYLDQPEMWHQVISNFMKALAA